MGIQVFDSLRALVGALGNPSRDKSASLYYAPPTLDDNQIINAYRSSWMAKKIVKIPADDALRNWRDWQAKADNITKIEAEEKRLGIQGKLRHALRMSRLFGGAAIYLHTGDDDPSMEFRPDRIQRGGLRHVTVLTRRQLTAGEIENDPLSEWYGRPRSYAMTGPSGAVEIHPSRLILLNGEDLPDPDVPTPFPGWGESVLNSTIAAIHQADGTAANIASLVFEAKIDVIRYPDLTNVIQTQEGRDNIVSRFFSAAAMKSNNGMLILDKDEEYEQKSQSFTTLPETLMAFLQLVSGAADIPATRFLGQTPSGLAATGESDLRNYYDRINAVQTLDIQPAMGRFDEALIRSALGDRPDEIHYVWASLWQISDKERAEIGELNARSAKGWVDTGLFPQDALAKAAANQAVEMSVYPGLDDAIDEAGGFPDFDAILAEEQKVREEARARFEAASGDNDEGDEDGATADAAPRTLYVSRKVLNGAEIVAWAKSQGIGSTLPASDMHVTIAFSRKPVDWMEMGAAWESEMTVPAGGPRLIERFDGGAVVLLFAASELQWRHRSMVEAGASWDWPDYQPHITLTYEGDELDLGEIEPYQGPIKLGPEIFAEVDEGWKQKIDET